MSGATLINPNQDRNYFMNKPMSNVNLNVLVNTSSGNNSDRSAMNSNSRREYVQKQNNNNHHMNNNNQNNNNFKERNSKQSNQIPAQQNSQSQSYISYMNQRENRKSSPYCRDRQSSDEQNEAQSKTKAISKQYKTLKLSKKFDLSDNVKRQQMLRLNVNCYQNKYSKVNNNIIPTLPKFLLQQQTPQPLNNLMKKPM